MRISVFVFVCTAAVFNVMSPLSRALSLTQVFEAVGPVVELVVVRDKFSHESKGSAFVWYTNKADADQVGRPGRGGAAQAGWASARLLPPRCMQRALAVCF